MIKLWHEVDWVIRRYIERGSLNDSSVIARIDSSTDPEDMSVLLTFSKLPTFKC